MGRTRGATKKLKVPEGYELDDPKNVELPEDYVEVNADDVDQRPELMVMSGKDDDPEDEQVDFEQSESDHIISEGEDERASGEKEEEDDERKDEGAMDVDDLQGSPNRDQSAILSGDLDENAPIQKNFLESVSKSKIVDEDKAIEHSKVGKTPKDGKKQQIKSKIVIPGESSETEQSKDPKETKHSDIKELQASAAKTKKQTEELEKLRRQKDLKNKELSKDERDIIDIMKERENVALDDLSKKGYKLKAHEKKLMLIFLKKYEEVSPLVMDVFIEGLRIGTEVTENAHQSDLKKNTETLKYTAADFSLLLTKYAAVAQRLETFTIKNMEDDKTGLPKQPQSVPVKLSVDLTKGESKDIDLESSKVEKDIKHSVKDSVKRRGEYSKLADFSKKDEEKVEVVKGPRPVTQSEVKTDRYTFDSVRRYSDEKFVKKMELIDSSKTAGDIIDAVINALDLDLDSVSDVGTMKEKRAALYNVTMAVGKDFWDRLKNNPRDLPVCVDIISSKVYEVLNSGGEAGPRNASSVKSVFKRVKK